MLLTEIASDTHVLGHIIYRRRMRHWQGTSQQKTPRERGFCWSNRLHYDVCIEDQSPKVSREALPPAAVVLTVTTFSVAKRSR